MNKKRLLKLADLLEADANNPNGLKFDMGTWGESSGETAEISCGTRACAMGLAALSGAFKRQGLHYEITGDPYSTATFIDINFKDEVYSDGMESAEKLFGITDQESEFLFDDNSYPQRYKTGKRAELYVAKRIRDFVAGKVGPQE